MQFELVLFKPSNGNGKKEESIDTGAAKRPSVSQKEVQVFITQLGETVNRTPVRSALYNSYKSQNFHPINFTFIQLFLFRSIGHITCLDGKLHETQKTAKAQMT